MVAILDEGATMKLFLIHTGFYDLDLCEGIYESHANYFVVASDFQDARLKAKSLPDFKSKKMHVDGIQEITLVDGFEVQLKESPEHKGVTRITSHRHRDLAPPAPALSPGL